MNRMFKASVLNIGFRVAIIIIIIIIKILW